MLNMLIKIESWIILNTYDAKLPWSIVMNMSWFKAHKSFNELIVRFALSPFLSEVFKPCPATALVLQILSNLDDRLMEKAKNHCRNSSGRIQQFCKEGSHPQETN